MHLRIVWVGNDDDRNFISNVKFNPTISINLKQKTRYSRGARPRFSTLFFCFCCYILFFLTIWSINFMACAILANFIWTIPVFFGTVFFPCIDIAWTTTTAHDRAVMSWSIVRLVAGMHLKISIVFFLILDDMWLWIVCKHKLSVTRRCRAHFNQFRPPYWSCACYFVFLFGGFKHRQFGYCNTMECTNEPAK